MEKNNDCIGCANLFRKPEESLVDSLCSHCSLQAEMDCTIADQIEYQIQYEQERLDLTKVSPKPSRIS